MFVSVFYFGDVFGSVFSYVDMFGSTFFIGVVYGLHKKQIAKFKALIVRGMLGSVFVSGDMFGSVFDFGDDFGSASDVNKPTVCLHI